MKFEINDHLLYTDPDTGESAVYKLLEVDEKNYTFKRINGPTDWKNPWVVTTSWMSIVYGSGRYRKVNYYNTKLGKVLYK